MDPIPAASPAQEENLRPLYFRHLGADTALPCPACRIPLEVIEFETKPPVRIERCTACEGLFFNPGEIEVLLETGTTPLVWLDPDHLEIVTRALPVSRESSFSKKCPVCSERMLQSNFGGRSAVMLDHCSTHGLWVEGNEMRRLRDWWRAGGKRIYRQQESQPARTADDVRPSDCDAFFGTSPMIGCPPTLLDLIANLAFRLVR